MVREMGNNGLSCRKATFEDIPALRELFRETVTTVNRRDYTEEETADWASCMDGRARWEELIDGMYVVVATDATGGIMGFAAINGEGYLHSMFVHKDCQRQGVATLLLGVMEKYARSKGIGVITSEVSITARPFFERKGYVVEKEQRVRANRLYMTNFKMRKQLGITKDVLETCRLIMRSWKDTDAETLYEYAKDPDVGPMAGWPPHESVEHSREIIRTVFAAPETYAVTLKDTGEPIGCAGIMVGKGLHERPFGTDEAEIGYWIGRCHWGNGYAPEAVDMLLRRCFTQLSMSAVWCAYYDGNHQSRRVMDKCGFSYHHTETDKPSPLGDIRTEHFMRITKTEWENGKTVK